MIDSFITCNKVEAYTLECIMCIMCCTKIGNSLTCTSIKGWDGNMVPKFKNMLMINRCFKYT